MEKRFDVCVSCFLFGSQCRLVTLVDEWDLGQQNVTMAIYVRNTSPTNSSTSASKMLLRPSMETVEALGYQQSPWGHTVVTFGSGTGTVVVGEPTERQIRQTHLASKWIVWRSPAVCISMTLAPRIDIPRSTNPTRPHRKVAWLPAASCQKSLAK